MFIKKRKTLYWLMLLDTAVHGQGDLLLLDQVEKGDKIAMAYAQQTAQLLARRQNRKTRGLGSHNLQQCAPQCYKDLSQGCTS